MSEKNAIEAAQVVLPCAELGPTLAFFTERLGFAVHAVFPADDPAVAVIAGHGLRVELRRGAGGDPGLLRLACRDVDAVNGGARELVAPNGTRIELAEARPRIVLPPLRPSLVVNRLVEGGWGTGRAGMQYRDLLPDRQGGRFIASHIRIPGGGPVPDDPHYHRVHFQMIYCVRGWVRVVYEDQGPPFVLAAGDAVLQPPEIRHRVLESSSGLEVVELGCPADHETHLDHEITLPTATLRPEREFDGQRFVRHQVARAEWSPSGRPAFEARDLGLAQATGGLADARVLRRTAEAEDDASQHELELRFRFVLNGALSLCCEGEDDRALAAGDAFVVPAGRSHSLARTTPDLELLQVDVPAPAAH